MGAFEAFSRTITLITRAKKLYILALLLALLAAPFQAYLAPADFSVLENQTSTTQGNVIMEEHGLSEEQVSDIMGSMENLGKLFVILLLLGSLFQYGIVKGALVYGEGSEVSLVELIRESILHFPGVLLINLFYGFIGLVFIVVSMIPIGIGLLTLPAGGILVLIGIGLIILTAAMLTTMSVLAVPLYADREDLGAAFEAFGAVLKNLPSSVGFGFLLWIGVLVIGLISGTVSLVSLAFPENIAGYVSAFLGAPFEAVVYELLWIGGVEFYRELKRKEELKKFEEEMKELGIEL
ncbi:hypothetical membrane protein, conserved [Thermococcus kodakarensis KOD1]|uniref:Hypothetical membrane protein, conserved n=1 Tax=Thermococcus kodakarensis (strain ATCC BAA-918 / JCM 12380 / KOD1) TaxID=69014 RepID=Q5JGF2_THEKO|nr:hypothetical protein [Thermococcus kodakarensis]WCN27208.1 hypothetical protein POG15_06050 [Thermococcus kodakarensis]WCN29494.1 hypothetical protein POG21_06045 [Thermococcus kodakarensis]BAD85381.1 hypothetical membrane protein, conserved [Thermococcus kodakarensis KOD1]